MHVRADWSEAEKKARAWCGSVLLAEAPGPSALAAVCRLCAVLDEQTAGDVARVVVVLEPGP